METNSNDQPSGNASPPRTSTQINDQLTNILLQEMIRQIQLDEIRNRAIPTPQVQNQNIRAFNRLLDTVYVTMSEYNRNMTEYSQNISRILTYVNQSQLYLENTRIPTPPPRTHTSSTTRRPSHTSSTTRRPNHTSSSSTTRRPSHSSSTTHRPSHTMSQTFTQPIQSHQGQPRSATSYTRNNISTNNSDSTSVLFSYFLDPLLQTSPINDNIRPMTREEISMATRTFSYVRDGLPTENRTCPITMEQFIPGDVLCEILGCNHIFRRPALMTWLQRSSQCPVCRYSLRTYNNERSNNPSNTTEPPNVPELVLPNSVSTSSTQPSTSLSNPGHFDLFFDSSSNQIPSMNTTFGLQSLVPSLEESLLEDDDDDVSDIEGDLNVD